MGRGRVRSDRRGASGQGSRTILSAREGKRKQEMGPTPRGREPEEPDVPCESSGRAST